MVTAERLNPEDRFTVSATSCDVEGSSMYLTSGGEYSAQELMEGLLLASGNDAALALAEAVSGDTDSFSSLMNATASRLGMDGSHFSNPHGLDAEDHYSTAEDLAKLMFACMDDPWISGILSLRSARVGDLVYENHNRLLDRCQGCLGGKTGYTMAAGRCLVSCCEREGMRLVCVTLNDPDDWNDHCSLYDAAFSAYCERDVTDGLRFQVPVVSGEREQTEAAPESLRLLLPRDAEIRLEAELPWFTFAPVRAGERAGVLKAYRDGEILGSVSIKYLEDDPVLPGGRDWGPFHGRKTAKTDRLSGTHVPTGSGGGNSLRTCRAQR